MLKQVQLSPSAGLSVSQLCLGTMNFGIPGRGHQGDWTLDVDAARPIFESAKTLGLTYFDCANVYGLGASEEVVGQLLSEIYARDEFVLTTKVAMPRFLQNQHGLNKLAKGHTRIITLGQQSRLKLLLLSGALPMYESAPLPPFFCQINIA